MRITRRPQNARPDTPVSVQVYPLRRATRVALQRWLQVRRLLMTEVTGGADWLWVSVRGNHGGVVAEGVEPEQVPPIASDANSRRFANRRGQRRLPAC
ncbi:hypothetical protein [Streptomyces colonosanans]|uniref:Uncharacterized protein n=1 Tax=Streptomyces colonosanans TaxID=1428652 RepID=A0A1S2PZM8_9ACTN|nr:hypothetical protein [Streptomyces colonosanans]OIJ98364.1 hypothetical protein BIV24_05810 [Streptomyces colonosanans]